MPRFGLLDLDGVVADFALAASKLHGLPYPPTEWNWYEPMSEAEFYAPFDEDFWATLPETPEAHAVVDLMRERFGNRLAFLTSPAPTRGCREGKERWAARFDLDVIPYRKKYHLASPWHVLVDDAPHNVEAFRMFGDAFLWPQPWNGAPLTNRVEQLRNFLRGLP